MTPRDLMIHRVLTSRLDLLWNFNLVKSLFYTYHAVMVVKY